MNSRSSVSLRRCLLQKPRSSMRHAIPVALLGMICAVIVAERTTDSIRFPVYNWTNGITPNSPPSLWNLRPVIHFGWGSFKELQCLVLSASFHFMRLLPSLRSPTSNMHCQSMLAMLLPLWNLPSPGVSLGLQWCFTGHLSWGWCHQVKGHASSTSRHSIHRTSIDVWIS